MSCLVIFLHSMDLCIFKATSTGMMQDTQDFRVLLLVIRILDSSGKQGIQQGAK